MAIRKIIRYPAPSLRAPCRACSPDWPTPVEGLAEHLQDLRDTLAAAPNGLALASNQIAAAGLRCFVMRPGVSGPAVMAMGIKSGVQPMPEACINPTWTSYAPTEYEQGYALGSRVAGDHHRFVEGCLSVPELTLPVVRPLFIELEYTDGDGTRCVVVLQGLLARIAVHECDHLAGLLIVDHADQRTQVRVRQEAIRNRKRGR